MSRWPTDADYIKEILESNFRDLHLQQWPQEFIGGYRGAGEAEHLSGCLRRSQGDRDFRRRNEDDSKRNEGKRDTVFI